MLFFISAHSLLKFEEKKRKDHNKKNDEIYVHSKSKIEYDKIQKFQIIIYATVLIQATTLMKDMKILCPLRIYLRKVASGHI